MALLSLEELGLAPACQQVSVDDFSEVRECDYKEEHYSVRDNGSVMRHPKPGKKPRPTDNAWTFGKKNESNGYMYLGTHRIHIICAIAFHGERDSKVFVVDHIDTNRCNNRKDNLRWLTRLENALNNPITRKRIEWLCGGDIQKFIENPKCLQSTGRWPDLEWMRTVTPEEARNAKENLERWSKKPIFTPDPNLPTVELKRDKEWMFKAPKPEVPDPRTPEQKEADAREWHRRMVLAQQEEERRETLLRNLPNYVQAISPAIAGQRNWGTPSEFPCCPDVMTEDVIERYAEALKEEVVFCRNRLWESTVLQAMLIDGGTRIAVATSSSTGLKDAVAVVYVDGAKIIHETYGTYFSEDGVRKAMTELQGLEWTGGDVFDDYC